jgi:hypothetical protein
MTAAPMQLEVRALLIETACLYEVNTGIGAMFALFLQQRPNAAHGCGSHSCRSHDLCGNRLSAQVQVQKLVTIACSGCTREVCIIVFHSKRLV